MSATTKLHGVAVVTGAGSGIGQAVARALVAAGVSGIALLDLNPQGLETTKSLLSQNLPDSSKAPNIQTFTVDVSSAESVEKTYAAIHQEFGRIDYSIHAAGIVIFSDSLSLSIEHFDKTTAVNYRGLWLCQRAALGVMRTQTLNNEAYPDANIPAYRAQRGAIVNCSSNLAVTNIPSSPAYCSSKAAVSSLTRSDALDFAADRIRVNAVLPGVVDTPMTTSDPQLKAMLEAGPVLKAPIRRMGKPEEIADVIVFLCSTAASFVTGAGWLVDGGYTLT